MYYEKWKLKKLIALAPVVVSTFASVACGNSSSDDSKGSDSSAKKDSGTVYRTLDEIKKDGTINIGVFSDKNPFGYVDENGEYQGYDVYFANRIGEDLGVKSTLYLQKLQTVSSICRQEKLI